MSLLNEESVTDIIKDIDSVQETQQHSVTIDHTWSIKDIFDLINTKRPGEKIESEQFSYENKSTIESADTCKYCIQNQTQNEAQTETPSKCGFGKFSLLPSSYSLNFELACDYLVNNSQWRLEINKSSNDLNYISLSALLLMTNQSQSHLDSSILKSLEQNETANNSKLTLKIKFYILNDKMNQVFEKDSLETNLDLSKLLVLKQNKKTNLINRFQIDKFCQIKTLLKWLNNFKSDDFWLISEFKLYTQTQQSSNDSIIFDTKNRLKSKLTKTTFPKNKESLSTKENSSSFLILNYKHAWNVKNWRNFLMPGTTSHTFLNDLDISNMFSSSLTNKLKLNEFGDEIEQKSQTDFTETVKFGKFRSKLFSLVQTTTTSIKEDLLKMNKNKIEELLKQVKWKLQLYPNGYSQEYENNLSLFVNFSQLTGELNQFTPNLSKKTSSFNYNLFSNSSKNIEETFYDSNDDIGLILLIKSPPSSTLNALNDQSLDLVDDDLDDLDMLNHTALLDTKSKKSKRKSNLFETFVKASFQISILDSNGNFLSN